MLALLDADIIGYRVGFTTQAEEGWVAKARCDEMIEGILAETNADQYQLWLSDKTSNNFRTKFYPEYKANRKDFVPPIHLDLLKEHMIENWGAQIAIEQEADDALGIEQTKYNGFLDNPEYGGDGSVICSIDKDLKQIPGNHYNFVTKEKSFVTPEDGLKCFYRQLIIGDTSDNIQGCPKVGPVGAAKCLAVSVDECDLFYRCQACYYEAYEKRLGITDRAFVDKQILQNGRCLKIRTFEGEVWQFPNFPKLSQTEATESLYTAPTPVVNNRSTELGLQSSQTDG